MKILKEIAEGVGVLLFLAFICMGVYYQFHGIGSGRHRVIVPNGDYTTIYRTDSITKAGNGCIQFTSGGVTRKVCGSYTIR